MTVKIVRKEERSIRFCKLGQYLYNLMLRACPIHLSKVFTISLAPECQFLSIPVPFLGSPTDSSGVDPFLQESGAWWGISSVTLDF